MNQPWRPGTDDARLSGIHTGERELAAGLVGAAEEDILIIVGLGFVSFELGADFVVTGADLLGRVTKGMKLPAEKALKDGSYLSTISSRTRLGIQRSTLRG